jgi:hypothetical protein
MGSDLQIIALLIAFLVIAGVVSKGRAFIGHHGLFTIAARHLTGHTLTGTHLTDAGWFSPATAKPARTNTGRTRRFWYLPRAHRMARRCARYAVIVLLLVIWKDCPFWEASLITVTVLGAAGGWAGWRAWIRLSERKHHRTWVKPLHLVAAHQVGLPLAADPRSWLEIAPDRSYARLELPQGYNPKPDDQKHLVATVIGKLGMESPEPRWMLAGPRPVLELVASSPPPPRVLLGDIRDRLDAVKPDELVWGIGKHGTLITTSLSMDSPHIGLSIGSGGGKSRAARNLLAQMLYRGSLGIILDVKQLSQHWAAFGAQLPNVYIAREPAEIHNTALWLAVEMTRRNREGRRHADIEGNVPADVLGPRVIIVGEELNATIKALRAYWREIRTKDDPTRSPALNALDTLSMMGRQVSMNIVFIGQRLSVAASGGDGDSKENIGTIALGRYSPSNWRMNASDFPMPPKSMVPGRLQIVTDTVREVQGVDINGWEARQLAVAGAVASFPPDAPGARVIAGHAEAVNGAEHGSVTVTSPVRPGLRGGGVTGLVTLSEAVEQGIVGRSLGALRIARHRHQLPAAAGVRGNAQVWQPEELREWDLAGR